MASPSHSLWKVTAARLALLLTAVALLASCGPSGAASTPKTLPSSASQTAGPSCASAPVKTTPAPSPAAVPSSALFFNSAACVDIDGLHIQTAGIDCGAWVVLSGQQATYDTGTIQQMTAYLDAFANKYVLANQSIAAADEGQPPIIFTPQLAATLPPLPATLQAVPGDPPAAPGAPACSGLVDVTNTGSSTVAIDGLGVTLTTASAPNVLNYHLVDACSLPGFGTCPSGGIGGQQTCTYEFDVTLHSGRAGTHIDAMPNPVPGTQADADAPAGCSSPIYMTPGALAEVRLVFNSPSALLYTLQLALTLGTSNGATTLVNLPAAFDLSLAFTHHSQFSCYALQGHSFIAEAANDKTSFCL